MLLCCLLWGLNQVAAKAALTEITPLWQAGLRSLGAAVLVWAWSALRGIPLFERDGSLKGGLLAGLLFGLEFACIFIGLQYTTASRMVVFIYLSPFVVALGMPFISAAERLNLRQIGGLLLAFGAVAWAFAEGFGTSNGSDLQWFGDSLGLLSAPALGRHDAGDPRHEAVQRQRGEDAALPARHFGRGGSLWRALLTGEPAPAAWSLRLAGLVGFQTVIVSFASYLLWFWMIRHYPATRLASFTLATPLFGLLAGAVLLGEPVTHRLVVALVALAAGVVLVNK